MDLEGVDQEVNMSKYTVQNFQKTSANISTNVHMLMLAPSVLSSVILLAPRGNLTMLLLYHNSPLATVSVIYTAKPLF